MNTVPTRQRAGYRAASLRVVVLAALSASVSLAFAAPVFDTPAADFNGRVYSPGAEPGAQADVAGRSFVPGQKVTLTYGGQVLNADGPLEVDAEGGFKGKVAIPANAAPGLYPIVIQAVQPPAALIYDLKVSPNVPLSAQDRYTLTAKPLSAGLYQVAYSPKSGSLFVTSAVGRPPVKSSKLLKVDPATLDIVAEVEVAEAPNRKDGHRIAVYGVAVDDAKGTVWVTNTRDDSVAVYNQKDLSLVKQFEPGVAPHARDVVVDAELGKAYVSTPMLPQVVVFDAAANTFLKNIEIVTAAKEGKFGSFSLALDPAAHKLYTVSSDSGEAAVIDTRTDTVEKLIPLKGVKGAIGVAVDPKSQRLFVASQGSDNIAVIDLVSGNTLATVPVGAGTLNVAFDPVSGHAFASNRAAGTVTVVDREGKIVANLPGGSFTNHAQADGKGAVYVVNKARGKDDQQGDRITRIVPKP